MLVFQAVRGHPGQGVGRGGLGCTEATTGIHPIAPLSGGGATLFISRHTHWDYENAGGLKQKHSPLLSFATAFLLLFLLE